MRGQVEALGEELGRPVAHTQRAAVGKIWSFYSRTVGKDNIERYVKRASEQIAGMAAVIESQMGKTREQFE